MPAPNKSSQVRAPKRVPAKKRKVYREKHISLFFIAICGLQSLFVGGLLLFWLSLKMPDLSTVANYQPPQATLIFDRHGRIVDRMFIENRTVVPLSAMSPHLPKAFVAAEDGRFYEHPGLDFWSVFRALINNLKDGARSQGGSTITQQVAKSLLLTPEKTYIRKFKEAILAWRIDTMLSKDEILYIYLNQIYLGESAHGVQAAAQVYFGKDASRLSLAECALLAGLPQAPSRYSLFDHPERAVERQKYVLNRMAADGYISHNEARAAYEQRVRLEPQVVRGDLDYYLTEVKEQTRKLLGGNLQQAGARVYTHLDPELQQLAAEAVRRGVRASQARQALAGEAEKPVPQGALVALTTSKSRVLALVGGSSFTESPFNRASQARRPAGSTLKPFVFAAACKAGLGPDSPINDTPITITGHGGKPWSPKNYSGRYHGMTTLQDALANSLNAATVRLMQQVGYREVHRLLTESGISAKLPPDLSLALGAVDLSLLELTGAYVPFAGNGSYQTPSLLEKVETADGRTLSPSLEKRQVYSRDVVVRMQTMLASVVRGGTGKGVSGVPGVRGGKTGTSDENRDAWFIGFDGQFTVGVWVGNDRNESLGRTESGGTAAANIWRDFMQEKQAGSK